MNQPNVNPITTEMIEGVMSATSLIAEAVVGYHRKLVDGGIGQDIAEQMTKDFHSQLMAQIAAAQSTAKKR